MYLSIFSTLGERSSRHKVIYIFGKPMVNVNANCMCEHARAHTCQNQYAVLQIRGIKHTHYHDYAQCEIHSRIKSNPVSDDVILFEANVTKSMAPDQNAHQWNSLVRVQTVCLNFENNLLCWQKYDFRIFFWQ